VEEEEVDLEEVEESDFAPDLIAQHCM